MPRTIEYVGGQVEAEYCVTISWDFKANLADLPSKGIKVKQEQLGSSVPLRGDWSLDLLNRADELVIRIRHGGLAYAALGDRVTVSCQFSHLADGALRLLKDYSWPAKVAQPRLHTNGSLFTSYRYTLSKSRLAASGKLPDKVQSSIQKYRFSINFTKEPEGDVARSYNTPTPDSTKALQLANLSHSPHMNVRLLFKQADSRELELWTTADFLGKASDYYKALFASGTAETVAHRRSKRQRGPSAPSEQKPLTGTADSDPKVDWEDSDDETDAFLVERDWMSCATAKQDTADSDYQQIEVRETAYSTMWTVLLYLQTGHIKFAPIRSSYALPQDELITKRKASLATGMGEHPDLPPPVSPKSVYRLAHLLERVELQKMALDSFTSGLTINSAIDELFSPVSVAYDKLRKIVFDFVVDHWKEIKPTEAWQAVRAKMASGQTEGAAQILFDLFAAIDKT